MGSTGVIGNAVVNTHYMGEMIATHLGGRTVPRIDLSPEPELLETGGTSWSAGADLFLKTGTDVKPGSYTSKLTLSLFEDVVD